MIILSDTHGDDLKNVSLPSADVVLHCGDLTNDSRFAELERTLAVLRAIDAPLKLAIPGNHDFSLEPTITQLSNSDKTRVAEDDADSKASWEILRHAAQHDRIFLLPQGTHTFILPPDVGGVGGGGGRLRLFASPLTPRCGNWGFQYGRSNPHKWAIPPTTQNGDGAVDVVMTHGPPRGIRDGTGTGMQGGVAPGAGCAGLLAAVERARPRVHCFGHIHGAWGAEIIAWKRERAASAPIYSNLVDAQRSWVVASLLPATKVTNSAGECSLGPPPTRTLRYPSQSREEGHCCVVDISSDGEHFVERGAQTLFVNAAVELRSRPPRMPWMVDIDLPVAGEEDATAAAETMYRLLLRSSGDREKLRGEERVARVSRDIIPIQPRALSSSLDLTVHSYNPLCLDLTTLLTRFPYDPFLAHARERSQEKTAPERGKLRGDDGFQERSALGRKLPGEGSSQEKRRPFLVSSKPSCGPISDLHAAQEWNRAQSC
ncbi:Metallo-dependent phosphatase [Lindgomyces ingoldianus]|uniref:Metallo-dependent phosphatase n=1 Tax=Lindgomyces ingoldianus TaxID=673940 RepID=A0ACB6QFC7_9PLEO|nr:Metallo-dependent phosphatase [Lindgomyces ingoldianus]KAF2465602.1 Metallo-dependent phosphatase [Lindgomyces ingoldianus]